MATKTKETAPKKQAPKGTGAKPTTGAGASPVGTKPPEPTAPANPTTPKQPDDSQDLVVFAFRLTRAERDTIHAAAGSAKASKFVRSLTLAAARGDSKAVKETMEAARKTG